jgi:formylmethanofuran dehydrogenase subunit B
MQAVGMVTATLGEVRHRADLVIFWGVDPATTHPRHFERYSLEPHGEFVPNGRNDRTCVVIDSQRTPTADAADVFLHIKPGTDGVTIDILRELVGGSNQFDAVAIEQQSGVALVQWRDLARRMQTAHYGALFFDTASATESLLTLVRDMNRQTRFVCLPLGAAGNAAGAEQVLAWQTGYAGPVDFSEGYPRQRDGALSADVALVFECDPVVDPIGALPVEASEHLSSIPRVVLHTADVTPPDGAAVAFTVATPGIHAGGTVFRCDGVPLPLRRAIASPYPTAEVVLEAIEQPVLKLRAIGAGH